MRIWVRWLIQDCGTDILELKDVNIKSENEWNNLSDSDKKKRLQKAVMDNVNYPSVVEWKIREGL